MSLLKSIFVVGALAGLALVSIFLLISHQDRHTQQQQLHHQEPNSLQTVAHHRRIDPRGVWDHKFLSKRQAETAETVATVSISLVTNSTEDECGRGLRSSSVLVQLEYREFHSYTSSSPWEVLEYLVIDSTNAAKHFEVNFTYSSAAVQFRLRQLEHGGGRCGCWGVCEFQVDTQLGGIQHTTVLSSTSDWCHAFAKVSGDDSTYLSQCDTSSTSLLSFCYESASEARGALSKVRDLREQRVSSEVAKCGGESVLSDRKRTNFSQCDETWPRINVDFKLYSPSCNHPDAFEEGVEVSFAVFDQPNTGRGEWVPIGYFTPSLKIIGKEIHFEEGINNQSNTTALRGYVVPFTVIDDDDSFSFSMSLCGEEVTQRRGIQFRWLQTSYVQSGKSNLDVWSFDMINIVWWANETHNITLASSELFDNTTVWNEDTRGACLVTNALNPCLPDDSSSCPQPSNARGVAFGLTIPQFPEDINSHLFTTAELNLPPNLLPVPPVIQDPSIEAMVERVTHQQGDSNVSFSCLADGYPLPKISWIRNGILIDVTLQSNRLSVNRTVVESTFRPHVPHAVLSMLSISNVQPGDAAKYTCQAFSDMKVVGKSIAVLEVIKIQIDYCARSMCQNNGTCTNVMNGPLCECPLGWIGEDCETAANNTEEVATVVTPPIIKNLPILYAPINLTCDVSGIPRPSIQWFKDGQLLENERLSMLKIDEVHLSDRGRYHCVTTNMIGNDTSDNVVLNIKGIAQYRVVLNISEEANNVEASQVEIENLVQHLTDVQQLSVAFSNFFIINVTSKWVVMNKVVSLLVTLRSNRSEGIAVGTKLKEEVERLVREYTRNVQNGRITIDAVRRFDGCQTENTSVVGDISLQWPETSIGQTVSLPCPCGNLLNEGNGLIYNRTAHRTCGGDFVGGGEWAGPEDEECDFSLSARQLCELTLVSDTETAVSQLQSITADESQIMAFEVGLVSHLLVSLSDGVMQEQNISVVREFFSVVENILEVNTTQLAQSQQETNATARILNVVNMVSTSIPIPENETEQIISFPSFAVSVREVDPGDFSGQTFSVSLEEGSSNISRDSLKFGGQSTTMTTASIKLPDDLFEQINATNKKDVRISHTVFLNDTLFVRRETGVNDFEDDEEEDMEVVGSVVMAATLSSNLTVKNLETYIEINFTLTINAQESHNVTEMCVFWDIKVNDWSPEGCEIVTRGDTFVVCGCNHLTHFALLLDINPQNQTKIPTIKHLFFEAVSYIGSAVSSLCLLITIATYLSSKPLRTTIHGQLLVNLCFSFLGIYVMFVVASLSAEVDNIWCAISGALLQYFMLAAFAIMAAESIILYINLVVVLGWNTIKSRYALKTALISWIAPAVIVILCVAPDYKNYTDDDLCRPYYIQFYVGILAPFGVMYLFNWIVFLVIFVSLLKRSCTRKEVLSANDKLNTPQAIFKRHFITAVCLSLLFGIGWGFGILATNQIGVIPVRIMFQAFFIAFVSLQGVLIFVMQCLRSSDARNEWKRWMNVVTCGKIAAFEFSQSSTQTRYTPANYMKRASNSNESSLPPKLSSGNSDFLQSASYSEDQSTPTTTTTLVPNGRTSHDSSVTMTTNGTLNKLDDYSIDEKNGTLKQDASSRRSKTQGLAQVQIHPWYKVTSV